MRRTTTNLEFNVGLILLSGSGVFRRRTRVQQCLGSGYQVAIVVAGDGLTAVFISLDESAEPRSRGTWVALLLRATGRRTTLRGRWTTRHGLGTTNHWLRDDHLLWGGCRNDDLRCDHLWGRSRSYDGHRGRHHGRSSNASSNTGRTTMKPSATIGATDSLSCDYDQGQQK